MKTLLTLFFAVLTIWVSAQVQLANPDTTYYSKDSCWIIIDEKLLPGFFDRLNESPSIEWEWPIHEPIIEYSDPCEEIIAQLEEAQYQISWLLWAYENKWVIEKIAKKMHRKSKRIKIKSSGIKL